MSNAARKQAVQLHWQSWGASDSATGGCDVSKMSGDTPVISCFPVRRQEEQARKARKYRTRTRAETNQGRSKARATLAGRSTRSRRANASERAGWPERASPHFELFMWRLELWKYGEGANESPPRIIALETPCRRRRRCRSLDETAHGTQIKKIRLPFRGATLC